MWTLKDEVLLDFAQQMQAEEKFHRVFYDGRIRTPHDMLEVLQQPANLPVFAFMGSRPIGVAWLNGLCGNRAFAHFCMLNSARGKPAFKACRMFLDYWMSFEDAGEPILEFLIGVIMETNERAVRFVEALGFKRLGVIPQMLEDAYTGDRASAVVSYFSRFEDGRQQH